MRLRCGWEGDVGGVRRVRMERLTLEGGDEEGEPSIVLGGKIFCHAGEMGRQHVEVGIPTMYSCTDFV